MEVITFIPPAVKYPWKSHIKIKKKARILYLSTFISMKFMGIINWVAFIVLLIALFFVIARWLSKLKDQYLKSDIKKALAFKEHLLIISHVFHSGGDGGEAYRHTRLTWVNMGSGKIVHKRVVEEELDFCYQHHNILVLKTDRMYYAFNLSNHKKLFDRNFLFQMEPSIHGEKISQIHFNPEELSFSVVTLKGNKKTITPNQWLPPIEENSPPDPSTVFGFKKSTDDSFFYISYLGEQAPQSTGLLNAVKLAEGNQQLYLKHADTLADFSPFFISAANKTGQLQWSVSNQQLGIKHRTEYDQPARINFVFIYNDLLILVVDAKRDLMLGLNTQTGDLIWKHGV
jgi:hypothetical protein